MKSKTLLDASNMSLQEKARILFQALGDDVISKLDHIPDLNSNDAYGLLWESLDSEYSRYPHGVASYILELTSELQRWPVCHTSSDLKELYKFLKFHHSSLLQIGQESQIEHIAIKLLILSCLTGKLQESFSTLMNQHPNMPIVDSAGMASLKWPLQIFRSIKMAGRKCVTQVT